MANVLRFLPKESTDRRSGISSTIWTLCSAASGSPTRCTYLCARNFGGFAGGLAGLSEMRWLTIGTETSFTGIAVDFREDGKLRRRRVCNKVFRSGHSRSTSQTYRWKTVTAAYSGRLWLLAVRVVTLLGSLYIVINDGL